MLPSVLLATKRVNQNNMLTKTMCIEKQNINNFDKGTKSLKMDLLSVKGQFKVFDFYQFRNNAKSLHTIETA